MSDGREQREDEERRREQEKREDREDLVNRHDPDEWKPERVDSRSFYSRSPCGRQILATAPSQAPPGRRAAHFRASK